ncbi:MAG: low molecular weight protein-tyrosine phosphatase, partial [Miltoncostaeaceae bacterium]|nr:low molecular weight protein-tyrosine phosphatase [Miltoncostaeaceae bacterium]
SAGTGAWHVGKAPDARATEAARQRGTTLTGAARQVTADDFDRFDLILAMDGSNLHELLQRAPNAAAREKVRMLRELDPASAGSIDLDVPDPYYGGPRGFDTVLDQVEAACRGLLDEIAGSLRAAADRGGRPAA